MRRAYIYLFSLFPLAVLFMVGLFPFIDLIYISATGWVLTEPGSQTLVGLSNYQEVLSSSTFLRSLSLTASYTAIALVIEILFGLALAYVAMKETRWNNLFAGTMIIPIFIPSVAAAFMWRLLLDGTVGPIPEILNLIGLRSPSFLGDPTLALLSVIMVDVWQWTPFTFLVLLAGMRSIPPSIIEAAEMDGAARFQMLRRIVLPSVGPFIIIATLFRSLELVRDYAKMTVLAEAALPVLTYRAFERAFVYFQEGIASVYAIVVFAIAFTIATVLMRYWRVLFP